MINRRAVCTIRAGEESDRSRGDDGVSEIGASHARPFEKLRFARSNKIQGSKFTRMIGKVVEGRSFVVLLQPGTEVLAFYFRRNQDLLVRTRLTEHQ